MNEPVSNPSSLSGKTAVVTGSSQGIGRKIAEELAHAGADVVVHAARRRDAAEQTVNQVRQIGRDAHLLMCDLADVPGRAQMVADAWNWKSGVDIWVNNAGADVLTGEAAKGSFEEKLQRLWHVDVEGTVALGRDVGQRMFARRSGAIVNMGWDQAWVGMEGDSGEMFAAIKGAVMSFTLSLARSLAPHVRVNAVAPGWIRTDWGRAASEYWDRRARSESLLERWGTSQDVARAVRFLASHDAAFVNGQILAVNGGFAGADPGRR